MILTRHRECKECPPHFVRIKTTKPSKPGIFAVLQMDNAQIIREWCYENIHHRFYVGQYTDFHGRRDITVDYEIAAFEDAAYATYFSLMLPTLQ